MKRILFLGRGGHTLPTYRALLNKVAQEYELICYSEVPLEKEWIDLEHEYTLRAATSRNYPRRLRELLLIIAVVRDHLRNPFHLVHAHSTYPAGFVAVLLQKLFGVPSLVALNAAEGSLVPDIRFGDLLYPRRARMNRWVIERARLVTTMTEYHRQEIVKNLGVTREIAVLPRGVDLDRFYFKRTNELNSPLVILSVGYLNDIKDPDTLLRAFYFIQMEIESTLIVVGRDYTNGAARKLVDQLGISEKVRFEGYVDHDRINEYYRKADVLLHTSRYESAGMVVAEAMASGVLVVGTSVGLLSDLSNECCMTAPRNPQAIAKSVVNLVRDRQKMLSMRERAYQWSLTHELDNCSRELLSLYKQLLKSS